MINPLGSAVSYELETLDWTCIILYFVVVLAVGMYFIRRAGKSMDDFFLAGRSLPWWLAGTSMVATMFAADTPLFHTGNVRRFGLDAGWLFFLPGFGVILASVLFARLWRRTRVLTEIELFELRYSGRAASFFRGFSALYGAFFTAAITLGWVTLAMGVIVESLLGIDRSIGIWAMLGVVLVYSVGSGIWGVVATDFIQYIVATFGSMYLAVVAVVRCGGFRAMNDQIHAIQNWSGSAMRVFPDPSAWNPLYTWWLIIGWLIVFGVRAAVTGEYLGQRIYASRNEKHASYSVLWFGFCYYVLNGWPWIITGLASIVVLGSTNEIAGISDWQATYPQMILRLMPAGMRGIMAAAMIAAFMSTVSTLLNWGSSYAVNDFYRRFFVRRGTDRHYVWVSRLFSVGLALFGGWFALQFENITSMLLKVSLYLTGGVFVWIFRWMWSRTNIWSEISALLGSVFMAVFVDLFLGKKLGIWQSEDSFLYYGQRLLTILLGTTIIWLVVTLLTRPVSDERLVAFYRKVAVPGPGWSRIRALCRGECRPADSLLLVAATWLAGIGMLFGVLFAIGFGITCNGKMSLAMLVISLVSAVIYFKLFGKLTYFEETSIQEQ